MSCNIYFYLFLQNQNHWNLYFVSDDSGDSSWSTGWGTNNVGSLSRDTLNWQEVWDRDFLKYTRNEKRKETGNVSIKKNMNINKKEIVFRETPLRVIRLPCDIFLSKVFEAVRLPKSFLNQYFSKTYYK